MKGQEEERQRRDCEKEEEKEEKRREWESKGEGRGGRRFMNSVAQTRQEKTREGTVKKCNTFHGYCWAGSSPVHTHTHTPSCGGGFGCLCTRTFFQWWPMGHMKPSSNDSMPTSSTFSSSWRAQGHSKLASLSAHLPMHSPLASTSAHACEFYPCVTCNCM